MWLDVICPTKETSCLPCLQRPLMSHAITWKLHKQPGFFLWQRLFRRNELKQRRDTVNSQVIHNVFRSYTSTIMYGFHKIPQHLTEHQSSRNHGMTKSSTINCFTESDSNSHIRHWWRQPSGWARSVQLYSKLLSQLWTLLFIIQWKCRACTMADWQCVRMTWVNLQRIHSERVSFVQPPGPSNQALHCCSERVSEVDYFLLCAREKQHLW